MTTERAKQLNHINWMKLQMREQEKHDELFKRSNFRPATFHPHPRQAEIDAYAAIPSLHYGKL